MLNIFRKRAKKTSSHDDLNSKIRWVAEVVGDSAQFKERARKAALELGPDSIDSLTALLHSEHTHPKELEADLTHEGA